jgi:hypothetical protein
MVTEVQTLCARVKAGRIDPRIQTVAGVPDSDLEFYWNTVATVGNLYDAKKVATPAQRIVRIANGKYPAEVVDNRGRRLHVFCTPSIPVEQNRADAVARLRNRAKELGKVK